MTSPHHLPHSPHHPSPLSPHHGHGLMSHPTALLQRTTSSGNRSIGAASTTSSGGSGGGGGGSGSGGGSHSRDSSHSISNQRVNEGIRLGAASPAFTPSTSGDLSNEGPSRPSLRGTLSDGLPPSVSSFYSSTASAGSTGNLAPPNLMHAGSNVGSPGGSVGSPMSGSAPMYAAHGTSSSSAMQQPPVTTPPLAGPLSSSDSRTSLLVLNLPFKARWQDLKDLFRRSAGTVLRADVSLTPDGRSRGFGSVLMRDAEDAQRAKECFDGFEWNGRKLEVHIEKGGGGGWGFAANGSPLGSSVGGDPSSSSSDGASAQSQIGLPLPSTFNATSPMPSTLGAQSLGHQNQSFGTSVESLAPIHYPSAQGQAPYLAERSYSGGSSLRGDSNVSAGPLDYLNPSDNMRRDSSQSPSLVHSASSSRRPSFNPATRVSSENMLMPQGSSLSQSTTPTLPPPQVQQLRASSFSGGSRRPSGLSPMGSAGSLGPPTASSSPGLPLPPFPPPAPSPSSQTSLPPGTIPTQHQLAVLSAQAAQAAVAAQQARVLAEYGGMPDGSYYGRTLFVGNLSYATQWQDLKDLFRAAGNVLRADIALGAEGRSRGFGTVLFGSKEEAARAVRMFHGYDHSGRTLKVHFDRFARMESPPYGILIPPRAEDYTSAFSAAQPPSNLGAGGGGAMKPMAAGGGSIGGIASPAVYMLQQQQQQLMAAGHSPYPLQAPAQMPPQQQTQQHALPRPPHHYQQQPQQYWQALQQQQQSWAAAPSYNAQDGVSINNGVYTPRGSLSSASGVPAGGSFPPSRTSSPSAGLLQAFEPSSASSSRRPSALATATPVVGDERGIPRQQPALRQAPSQQSQSASQTQAAASSSTGARKGPSSRANAAPGRIALPSPPSMQQQQAHPYQQQAYSMGSAFSPEARAPMPMTPGVPLTPGMPGFSFANLPPQTPPPFTAPMMSPGLGLMSPPIPGYQHMAATPGAQAPPTPWQYPGMSAAPGAPLRMGGNTAAGGGARAAQNAGYNAFYAGMGGGAQMPQTPHWGQPYRAPTQQQQQHQRAGDVGGERGSTNRGYTASQASATSAAAADSSQIDGSAISSREASPLPPLSGAADGYPFPAVVSEEDSGDDEAKASGGGSATVDEPPSSSSARKKPHLGPAGISLVSRRASTNSPAVSPSIYGAHPATVSNSSFGYFGAAMAASGDAGGSNDGGGPLLAGERPRRPSLDADALRTPMREDLGEGVNYFSPVVSGGESSSGTAAGSNGHGYVPSSSKASAVPNIAIAAGHTSTEEMAAAIAKMSIQGKALLKRGNSGGSGGQPLHSPNNSKLGEGEDGDKTP